MASVILLLILVSLAIARSDAAAIGYTDDTTSGLKDLCDSKVYCEGPLLETVQLAGIFNDSKTFVDLYQLHDPDVTVDNFNILMNTTNGSPNPAQIDRFVKENFAVQDELDNTTLSDWRENPSVLKHIQNSKYRQWAKELNYIWKILAKKINNDLVVNPQRHSLIYVKNPFVIPGGRFKEFYYWDSYWIIEGLLLCDMNVTAKGIIENFLSVVERYGFVPNGGRVYYLSRSQPPMLIPMVAKYYEFTYDGTFLKNNIEILEREFKYWQTKKTVDIRKGNNIHRMARYVVNSRGPRPESYKEDYRLAKQLSEEKRGALYNDLKAAAESGWDFSYRWCIATDENASLSLLNVSTSDYIPVELNAILEWNARLLSEFHNVLGNPGKVQYYTKIAGDYRAAIKDVLWNEDEGVWLDYDARNKRSRNGFYPSNLSPLYTMSYDRTKKIYYALKAIAYLKRNNVDEYLGGTPSSSNYTGEQWDFPNAWPPLQSFLVMGLYQTEVKEAIDLARTLADRWLKSNYVGYEQYGRMFEKYDALSPGKGGGGGEYNVQEGFGWTNGVVLRFLRVFQNVKPSMATGYDNDNGISR